MSTKAAKSPRKPPSEKKSTSSGKGGGGQAKAGQKQTTQGTAEMAVTGKGKPVKESKSAATKGKSGKAGVKGRSGKQSSSAAADDKSVASAQAKAAQPISFVVNFEETEAGKGSGGPAKTHKPPARLQKLVEESDSIQPLTKEEVEKKLEEAEQRRATRMEIRMDKIKDLAMGSFIGKPEVPPEDMEIK